MDNPQAKRAKGNLLVVDDDLSAWQTMEAFLTREGYEVRYAECPDGTHVLIAQRGWVLKIGFQRLEKLIIQGLTPNRERR